jgi:hypothetical protein
VAISMSGNEPDNLVLQHLRSIRDGQDAVRDTLTELVSRIGHLERSNADLHVQMADQSGRLDRVSVRLDRIEKRLGLVEA